MPSNEKTLKSSAKEELSIFINEENEISVLKMFVPSEVIKFVISYVKEMAAVHSESEKFIKIVIKMPFTMKIYGDSTSFPA